MTGCSATSLRCGVDGDATYLEIYSVPTDMGPFTRNVASMCGFAYDVAVADTGDIARINIIDDALVARKVGE